jgi:virginiamycin B lyase
MSRRTKCGVLAVVVCLGCITVQASAAQALSLKTFRIPGAPSYQVFDIARGPDRALWFTQRRADVGRGFVGRLSTGGNIRRFAIPWNVGMSPPMIVAGPDRAMWFVAGSRIGRITTNGQISHFDLPAAGAVARSIAPGPDGALWFVEAIPGPVVSGTRQFDLRIGRLTTSGLVSEFPLNRTAGGLGYPSTIVRGPDEALWFTDEPGGKIGRISTSGQITEFALPGFRTRSCYGLLCDPASITLGPDRALWFVQNSGGKIARLTTGGQLKLFRMPGPARRPTLKSVAAGAANTLWFVDLNFIGQISSTGRLLSVVHPAGVQAAALAERIVRGPDGAMWFTTLSTIGRIGSGRGSTQSPVGGGGR